VYRVRHYDQLMHPDEFKAGWRGLVIRSLNWVRWKLEVFIQLLVIKYIADASGMAKERTGVVTQMFKLDVQAEQLEKERTSPNFPEMIEIQTPRSDKYVVGGSVRSSVREAEQPRDGLPTRPMPANEMIARYMNPKMAKYARGRNYTMGADENDFDVVIREEK
jgi:hypothetical protein